MKRYYFWLAMTAAISNTSFGEIRNGYEPRIEEVRRSLKALHLILNENNLSVFQRMEINAKVHRLVEYISYFELTEGLLDQFRQIAPDMYDEINSVRSCTGQPITVFVRFAPEREMRYGAHGTTNLAHCESDMNLYSSEYGDATVSVKIASVNRSLVLLAHEFGHVKFQVRHLKQYTTDYSRWYGYETFKSSYIGHSSHDLSGRTAMDYENTFRDQYVNFLRKVPIKLERPIALLGMIRKSVGNQF